RRAEATSRRSVAVDLGSGKLVVTDDAIRSAAPLDVDHGSERHHSTLRVACLELRDVGRLVAIAPFTLRPYLKRTSQQIEVVDVAGPEIHLERIEDVAQGDIELVRPDAI